MTAAPSDLKYPAAPSFVINTAITPLTPTVVGEVTSYSVNPALPAGLNLNTTSGVISGTPTSVAAKASYTVKATNAGGSTTAIVSIVVNGKAPSIAYSSSYYGFTANVTAQSITPTVGGGAIVSWTISPALPAGLVFNTTDGTISGAPTAAAAPTMYTLTATNSGGESKATMTLAVAAAPLLNLGHSTEVTQIRYGNSSVISVDAVGHWVLQAYGSGAILASGDGACGLTCVDPLFAGPLAYPPVNLAGDTAIVGSGGAIQVLSASSGQLLATITGTWAQLASDGSYIATGSATALTAWSTAGQAIMTLPGDYSKALAFSAPGQIQVALGPAGQNVIQTITVPGGTSSVSPTFQGAFNTWFLDGARFLSNVGATVWTYSSAGVQHDITQVPSNAPFLVGQGNWLWTINSYDSMLDIYKVGASTSPAFTAPLSYEPYSVPSGMTIGVLTPDSNQITVIDLSGATPVSTNYTLPIASLTAYAATSANSWVAGNNYGVVLDGASLAGQPRYLTLGQALSVAAGTGYFSIATASGQIFCFDASTDAIAGTINFASSQLSTSADGTVLAAAPIVPDIQNPPATSINVYSLPSATLVNSFDSGGAPYISLSGSGTVLAVTGPGLGCEAEAITVSSGAPIVCSTMGSPNTAQVSPNGTLVAISTAPSRGGTTTNIYTNGALTTAVPGWAVGWLDNTRLLAEQFGQENENFNPVYEGTAIFSSSGTNLGSAPIPQLQTLQVAGGSIYAPQTNTIVSLTTGSLIWASADASCGSNDSLCDATSAGAVTGSQVIFSSGALVLVQPY
jgi:hypothetical protein